MLRESYKILLLSLVLLNSGCYSRKTHFIKHGYDSYTPKPDGYEVLVFDNGKEPDREYSVIGLVVVDSQSGLLFSGMTTHEKIIELLKKEARKHGADAIMEIRVHKDFELDSEADITGVEITKRSEAKAIVFKNKEDEK